MFNDWIPELILMKLGMYILAPEPISTTYFIHSSHQSVCVYPVSMLGNVLVKMLPHRLHTKLQ
jgi:hypothetical protein